MSTQFAWLIEAPGARYLGARHLGRYEFFWTEDHAKALRFHDETQADLTMMTVRDLKPDLFAFAALLGDAKAVEHGWIVSVAETVAPSERLNAKPLPSLAIPAGFEPATLCLEGRCSIR
jgi:hypothetical protein